MNAEAIGTFAGQIWNALDEAKAALTTKGIKKATKLKINEIYAAIGWLAREGKVSVTPVEGDIEIALL